jgi:hypothetical protein
MKLRNGKNLTKQNITYEMQEINIDNEIDLFSKEAKNLIDEIATKDVISLRIAACVDFYEYILQHIGKYLNHPRLATFINNIRFRIPRQFTEIAGLLEKYNNDFDLLVQIDRLSHQMLSVLAYIE